MDAELKQALADIEKRLSDRIDRSEARLVAVFDDWARTYELRARGATKTMHNFEERLGLIEERLSMLERNSVNPKAWRDGRAYPPAASPL